MKLSHLTSELLACRKSERAWSKLHDVEGYTMIEADWRLQRGGYCAPEYQITDALISHDGKHLYVKTNVPEGK